MGGGPKGYRSDTGGILPMPLAGRMAYERERLFGMTDAERAWRAQFIKDQHLAPHEPVEVPEAYNELYNPIRRFYRTPMNKFEEWLRPRLGAKNAQFTRDFIAKGSLLIVGAYFVGYYFMYHTNDWEQHNGVKFYRSKPQILPGDPRFPMPNLHHPPNFYKDRVLGFTDAVPDL